MENKLIRIVTILFLVSIGTSAFSQTYLMNGTTNNTTVNTCNGTLYDSGGSSGQYQSNESYTITVCSSGGTSIEAEVIAFATEGSYDYLYIYDGPSTASPLLIQSSGDPGCEGQIFESTGTCLTFRFTSEGSITAAGFQIALSCGFPCQAFTVSLTSPALPVLPDTAVYACPGVGAGFIAQGNYPNNNTNYSQTDANVTWNWTITTIDPVIYTGAGMTTLPYNFDEPGGTFVSLVATDINGCTYVYPDTLLVYVSVPPTFVGTMADQTVICAGEEVNYEGFVQVDEWIVTIPEIVNECFCADDEHYYEEQCAEFVHTAFAPGQTITSVNDIEALCMDLEHSYIGDLDMWITCPNGQRVDLIDYDSNSCGGTYFGEPVDDDSNPCTDPSGYGVLYHYCWTPTATETIEDVCGGFTSVIAEGNYLPVGNFSGLIGCPINGTWKICFQDNLYSDDGRVCDFVLQFADNVLPSPGNMWQFQNTYDPALFEWTGNGMNPNTGGTADANPDTPGSQVFTFSATDDFGCTFDTTVNVLVRNIDDPLCCVFPVTSAGPDDHVCSNTYTFNGTLTTGNTGSWALISGPGTATWASQNSPHAIVTVNAWGSYEFEWTEQNLAPTCADADRVIIEFYPMPNTTFTYDVIACNGDNTVITYIGNMSSTATFTWDFDGATVASGSGIGPYDISWATAGTHSIALQVSENGCDSPDTLVNIINPALLTHTLEVDDDPCFASCGGRAELTLTGGTLPYSYSWASPTNILPNLCAGNYSVTVTDDHGCTTSEDYVINEPPQLVINSVTSTNLTCYQSNDGTITVDAAGGTGNLTYVWSDMGNGPSSRTGLNAGNYCVTVEDENGCTVFECLELTQPDELLVTISPNIAICEGMQTVIQAQAMGGTVPYAYLWDQGLGYNPAGATLTLTPNTTTTYNVYVEDANGCTSNIETMIVTVSPAMVIDSMILENNRCYHSCDGSAEIVMHGGIQPLSYSWGSPYHVYEGLCAGIYTVTVTDIIGCAVSEMFIINEPTQITYTSSTQAATCFEYDDGEATIFVQGGIPPFEYLWPNGHDEPTLINHAGTYIVTVTDDHNCRITAPFTITEPTEIYVNPIGNRTVCIGQSTILNTQATGGSPFNGGQYDFHWTGNDGSIYNDNLYEVTPDHTTIYTLVVTDSHGCSSTPIQSTVNVLPELEILSVLTSNDTVCPGDPAIIYVDVIGGNGGPYLMTLQDGRVVPSPFTVRPDTTTMFYIQLADMCGTPNVIDSILINVRPEPDNVFVAVDVDGCPPYSCQFYEQSPDFGQTYLWDFGDNGFSIEKNPIHIFEEPGVYTVSLEVMNDFGCKHSRTVENMITVYQNPTALFEANPEVVSMLAAEVEFINHSVDAVSYYWFFGDGDSSLFVAPRHMYPNIGEYEVLLVAESEDDCRDTTTRMITVQNEFAFYMPTSFTPNGDGMNDCARPCGNGIDKNDFSLVVYDRWGNLVFETDKFDPEAPCDACTNGSWDGTDNGSRIKGDEILPNGMYQWYCEFKDWNGTIFKEQGTIVLVR